MSSETYIIYSKNADINQID